MDVPDEIIKLQDSIFVDNKHVNAIIKHNNKTEKFCVQGMVFKSNMFCKIMNCNVQSIS